jgi:hypothetical protein
MCWRACLSSLPASPYPLPTAGVRRPLPASLPASPYRLAARRALGPPLIPLGSAGWPCRGIVLSHRRAAAQDGLEEAEPVAADAARETRATRSALVPPPWSASSATLNPFLPDSCDAKCARLLQSILYSTRATRSALGGPASR